MSPRAPVTVNGAHDVTRLAAPGVEALLDADLRDAEVELQLLGATLLRGSLSPAAATVGPGDFVRFPHGVAWGLIQSLAAEGLDFDVGAILVGPHAESRVRSAGLDLGALRTVLERALASVATATGADVYARAVLEAASRRRLDRGARRVVELLADGAPVAVALDALRAVSAREEHAAAASARNDGAALVVRPAADLVAEPEEALDELWPGVVAAGMFTLLAGQAKAGKSWVLAAMVAALGQGRSWAGHTRAPVRVLYVTEEGRRTMRRRLRRFGVGVNVDIVTPVELPSEWSWTRQAAALVDRARSDGYELLVVDTLLGLAGLPADAANDDGAAGEALAPLARGAHAHGLAVAVAHHSRKDDGEAGRAIFGGLAFRRVPDVLVELRHVGGPDSPERELRVSGRLDEAPPRLLVRHVPGADGGPDCYEFCGRPGEVRSRGLRDQLLGILVGERRWLARDLLLRRAGGRRTDALGALEDLVASGHVRTLGDGTRGCPRLFGIAELPDHAPRLLLGDEIGGGQ